MSQAVMALVLKPVTMLDLSAVVLLLASVILFFAPVSISALFPLRASPRGPSHALKKTHISIGVRLRESNLRDQTSQAHFPQSGRRARIQSLFVYPVKSCRGIELQRSKVLPKGLEFDRVYTFARRRRLGGLAGEGVGLPVTGGDSNSSNKQPEWEIATLRQLPLLANVQVDVWLPDEKRSSPLLRKTQSSGSGSGSGFIVVRFPWTDAGVLRSFAQLIASLLTWGDVSRVPQREIVLPIEFPSPKEIDAKGYRYESLQFFTKSVVALNMASEVAPELATYLGAKGPLSLFRMDPQKQRDVFRNAPRKEIVGYQPVVDLQDAYPLHLLNLTSVRSLESKIPKSEGIAFLDALRFRPNIIVSGLPPYDEDDWRLIRTMSGNGRGQDLNFDVSCRTARCKLPNVDPATGIRHRSEPDNTLRKHRDIDEGAPKKACFGMHLCPLFGASQDPRRLQGFLEVGMEIDVMQRGPHYLL